LKKQEAKTQPSLVEKNSEVVSPASEVRKTTSEVEITEWEGEEDEGERGLHARMRLRALTAKRLFLPSLPSPVPECGGCPGDAVRERLVLF